MDQQLIQFVKTQATQLGLDPALACAVVEQESGWNRWAIRYEPAFYVRYEQPQNLTATEKTARAISWGLFQLMGQCARELGYKGDLANLCDPQVGVEWSLRHLAGKLKLANGDVAKGLLFWNGGGDTQYPTEVMARIDKYR